MCAQGHTLHWGFMVSLKCSALMTAACRTRWQCRWDDGNRPDIGKFLVLTVCEPNLRVVQSAFMVEWIYQHASLTIVFRSSLQGVPEDLLFFYQSIRQGGGVFRVDQCLLVYRYHEKATTHSVSESVPLPCSITSSMSICSGLVDPCLLLLLSWCHMTMS